MPPVYGPPVVYSEVLWAPATLGEGAEASITVPEGYRWIIREFIWFQPAPGIDGPFATGGVAVAGAASLSSFNYPPGTNSNQFNDVGRFCVVDEGTELGTFSISVTGTTLHISGTVLTLP